MDLRNCVFIAAIAVLSIAADVRSETGGCSARFKNGKLRGCFCALTAQDYSECRKGDDESCRYVGECVDRDDPKSTLFWAAIRGNTAEVQRLLATGPAGRDAERALIAAVYVGRETVVRYLLSQGVPADSKNKHGDTALFLVVEMGGDNRLSIVARLLAAGANPNSRNFSGVTPLIAAVYSRKREVAALLLKKGADPNAATEVTRNTALTGAADGGDLTLIRLLLEYGADLSHQNQAGLTAAEIARARGNLKVANLLDQAAAR